MKIWLLRNKVSLSLLAVVFVGTSWAVRHFHRPGQLDVVAAQAMDMSAMRPPTGAAPVDLVSVRQGSLDNTVTYTGTVQAYNEQDISPRITGTLVSMPVYPGDQVQAGQLVAQLDTAEVGAKAQEAAADAQSAELAERVAHLTHHLHHQAALDQATAQEQAALQVVSDAQAEAQADQEMIADAKAGVASAQANADYWKVEIVREKQLADAGAASQQEYQNELAQAQAAQAALAQAKAKVSEAVATYASALAKVVEAKKQVTAAQAGIAMARADLAVAEGQAQQAGASSSAAQAAAREAVVVEGYTHITSPANGVVTERPVAPGTLVQPGTVILRVAEIDHVRVQANVAIEDVAGIHPGSPVEIDIQGDDGKSILGHVTSVFPAANDQTRTAVVEAVIPNPGHRLLPGAFVTMRITKGNVDDKPLVPVSAITTIGGQSYVWLVSTGIQQVQYKAACGLIYSAADAKKYHYICPMDHKPLTLMKTPAGGGAKGTVHQVAVQTGASDGVSTEIISGDLQVGGQVVAHGQAGLSDGARVVATAWGANGPTTLPTSTQANAGQIVYRCVKCGLTFSAADAKRDNYIDPMDGGKLVPVRQAGVQK